MIKCVEGHKYINISIKETGTTAKDCGTITCVCGSVVTEERRDKTAVLFELKFLCLRVLRVCVKISYNSCV